jgi:hypothetical protein
LPWASGGARVAEDISKIQVNSIRLTELNRAWNKKAMEWMVAEREKKRRAGTTKLWPMGYEMKKSRVRMRSEK